MLTHASTTDSPVQVGVALLINGDESAVGEHNIKFEHSIGSHAMQRGQRRVSTASHMSTTEANGRLLTTYDHLTDLISGLIDFAARDTSADFDGRAGISSATGVFVDELDVLKMRGPDTQGATGSATTKEVMAGIFDVETEVLLTGEADGHSGMLSR